MELYTGILVIIFFLINLLIGYYSSRKKDTEDFFIANRDLGVFQSVMTISGTFMGAITLLVYTAFVFTYGISAIWIFLGYLIGFIIFTFFALHLWTTSRGKQFYTMTDYFKHRFGKQIALVIITVIFIWYFGTLSAQFIGGGKVLSEITGLEFSISAIIMCSVIFIYLIFGGFRSVVRTDIFQVSILILLLGAVILSLPGGIKVPLRYFNPFNAGATNIIAFLLLGILTPFATQDYWQKIYAMKDAATVKKSFILSGIVVTLVALLLTYIGLMAKTAYASIDADLAVLNSFTELVPSFFLGFVAIVFFAAILSTADTFLFLLAMNSVNDFFEITGITPHRRLLYTRVAIPIIGLAALGFALLYPDIVDVTIIFKSIGLVVAPIVLITWFTKGNPGIITATVIISTFLVVLLSLLGFVQPELAFISILSGFLIYSVLSLASSVKHRIGG